IPPVVMRRPQPITAANSFFFSSRRRHTRWPRDWSSDVCSSDLEEYEHAKARGAKIYGELVGYAANSDGYDMVAPSGEGAARCMRSEERRVGKECRSRWSREQ